MSARAASAPGAGVLDRLQVLRSAPTPLRGAPAATWTPSPRTGVGPLRVPGPGLQPSSHDTTTTRTDPAGSTLARPDFGPKDGVHLTAYVDSFLWKPDSNAFIRWQPLTAEMLSFLAGCLRNPNELLLRFTQMDAQQPDHFRTMLLVAGRALADTAAEDVDQNLAQQITDEAFAEWRSLALTLRTAWTATWPWREHGTAVRALAHSRGVRALTECLRTDPNDQARQEAAWALDGIGSDQAVEVLIQCLLSSEEKEHVRASAATALGRIGGQSAQNALADCLDVGVHNVRVAVRRAFDGRLREQAIERALSHGTPKHLASTLIECLEALRLTKGILSLFLEAKGKVEAGLTVSLSPYRASVSKPVQDALSEREGDRIEEALLRCLGDKRVIRRGGDGTPVFLYQTILGGARQALALRF